MTLSDIRNKQNKRILRGFNIILMYEFDALEQHRLFAEESLSDALKKLEKRVERDIESMGEEERSEYYDHMSDEFQATQEIYPKIQWNSQFLIVYSTFENALNEICKIVKKRSGFSLSFKDINGQGIERAKNYLTKVAGVNEPFQGEDWVRAKFLGEIRNIISHRNGVVDLEPDKQGALGTRISKENTITLKKDIPEQEDAEVILSSEFVRQAITSLKSLILAIGNYELYGEV